MRRCRNSNGNKGKCKKRDNGESKTTNSKKKKTSGGQIDHDLIRATDAALLIETDPRHRGESALEEAADQAHLRHVRLASKLNLKEFASFTTMDNARRRLRLPPCAQPYMQILLLAQRLQAW